MDGKPIHLLQPEMLRFKVYEPVLILGVDKFGMRPAASRRLFEAVRSR